MEALFGDIALNVVPKIIIDYHSSKYLNIDHKSNRNYYIIIHLVYSLFWMGVMYTYNGIGGALMSGLTSLLYFLITELYYSEPKKSIRI